MGSYVDALAANIDDERKVNGARREDWELALALVYMYPDTEPPVLRYQVEAETTVGVQPVAAFQTKEIAFDFGNAYIPLTTNFVVRDLHTNSIV